MRNAIRIGEDLIVTTDNTGGIGEKAQDVVHASDTLTASFATRVTLLEQWAANAIPQAVMIHNFTGETSWTSYVKGVEQVLAEANLEDITLTGSTETNMVLLQSALSITMIGREQQGLENPADGRWFTYGEPLVGEDLLTSPEKIASLKKLKQALDQGKILRLWPTGSKGIQVEIEHLLGETCNCQSPLNLKNSCGPSTVVLLKIAEEDVEEMRQFFGSNLRPIIQSI